MSRDDEDAMGDISARLDMLRNQIGKRNVESDAVIAELRSILSAETHPYRHETIEDVMWKATLPHRIA